MIEKINAVTIRVDDSLYMRTHYGENDEDFDATVWYLHTNECWDARLSDKLCHKLEKLYRQERAKI